MTLKNNYPNHIENIRKFIQTIQASSETHAILISGPAGWGKTTAVDEALKLAKVKGAHLGSYSTSLNFYNFLHENSSRFVIIDDSAGLFNDQNSMALLKAATWPQGGKRIVKWGSTSSKAATDEFEFTGKLIIICNGFPNSPDAEAVRSRSFPCKVTITISMAKEFLLLAAKDKNWFSNKERASRVAEFLIERLHETTLSQISYRTLKMGYELATHNPDSWKGLLAGMIASVPEDPKALVKKLLKKDLKVKEQVRQFEEITGLKRRTFFNYRKELLAAKSC